MSLNKNDFLEKDLHEIWQSRLLCQFELISQDGKKVSILDIGELNQRDGPDFLNARIRIDDLILHGAVEIHKESKDWYAHKHHLDLNYDKVILHVVAESKLQTEVRTLAGHATTTLNIYKYLASLLSITSSRPNSKLACNGLIPSISPAVFELQIEKAQQEYLEQKVGIFLNYIDEHEIISQAWKNALFITLCDAFGVPGNRDQMKELARFVIKQFKDDFKRAVQSQQKSIEDFSLSIGWNSKGIRLTTRPKIRVEQAVKLFFAIHQKDFQMFISENPKEIWFELLRACGLTQTSHNHRLFVSFYVPAMYALGTLLHSNNLKYEIAALWKHSSIEVPKSIKQKFGIFDSISSRTVRTKIGLVHQFNTYCMQKRCLECEVLNKAISS